VDGGHVTRVASENSGPLVAPGFLLFVRGGNLMAQRFDADRLLVSGNAAALAEHVWFNGYRWTPNASVSGNGLLVVQPGGEAARRQLTWFDLDGRVLGTVGAPGPFEQVVVSPDGKRALAVLSDESGLAFLWMYDLERGVASRFVSDVTAGGAAWSPDGREVAYSDMDGNVYVRAADGLSDARVLLKVVSANQRPTSWSADGKTLVIDRQNSGSWDLLTVPLAGDVTAQPLVATPAQETLGRVAPDGRSLAFISDETGRNELYVMPYPKGEKRRVSFSGAVEPFWLGRSGDLAWVNEGRLFAVSVGPAGPGPVRALLGGLFLGNAGGVSPSPDGKRLLVAMPVEGSGSGTLTLVTNWLEELRRR
jgi:Tol biopolymer transport system component